MVRVIGPPVPGYAPATPLTTALSLAMRLTFFCCTAQKASMHSAEGASGLRMRDRSALEMKSATSSSAASRSGSSCSRVLDLESGCLTTRRAADLALSRAVVAPGGASWNGRAVVVPGGASWNASVASANMQHRAARSEPGEPISSGWCSVSRSWRLVALRQAINHQRQPRNRNLSTDQPPPNQPHEADHCSAGAGSAGQSKQRAGSGAG